LTYNQVLPASHKGKAINFAKERYDSLIGYLNKSNLKIDNNAVENSIRPVALGRKNYLFCKTHESAQKAAIVHTFMAICKQHNVNPFDWLCHTLDIIDSTSIQRLESLLPQTFIKQDVVA
jgi:transposase